LIWDSDRQKARWGVLAALLLAGTLAGGCTQVYHHGYMVPDGALSQIAIGASQDQVLIVLGTPSTVATISGEVFYYISQRGERTSFLPEKEVDRRVVAVYFDRKRRV
jgi:outer membrane protein assembly factor BamE (lipoprotein component of BamABCDE complex)